MPNTWFRLYHEFADDPKVQMMPEAMQRRLVMLFCEKSKGETLHETQRAFHWRLLPAELAETKALFVQNGFIDEDWNVLNWNKRQFVSDNSTDRVKKHRDKKKAARTHETGETQMKRDETFSTVSCNENGTNSDDPQSPVNPDVQQGETFHETLETVGVTAPDTDTDSDTEKTNTSLAGSLPLADGTFFKITTAQVEDWKQTYPAVDVIRELREMREWSKANPRKLKKRTGIRRFIVNWLSREQDRPKQKTAVTMSDMEFDF